MKKTIAILVLAVVGVAAFAHPPKDIVMSYDKATMTMSIMISHDIKQSPSTDPKKHFVKDLSLKVNGVQALITNYSYGQFPEGETLSFKLNLKSGDKVSANARCSLAGEKTVEYTVK